MVAGCCEALHEVERPPNSHHNARMSQGTSYDERRPSEKENLTNMATDINNADDERGKKPKRDALMKARAQKPRGRRFIVGSQSPSAAANGMFKPEEPSSPVTPEREAARQLLNDEERKIVAAMERDLVRPLTEEEERLVLEPGPLIGQPPPK